jgi:uncharacterized protein YjbJ (UPF0337 family)
MDWNRVEGNWKQKGKVKEEQWGKLSDYDLDVISGRRDQAEGKIQERPPGLRARSQRRSEHSATDLIGQRWSLRALAPFGAAERLWNLGRKKVRSMRTRVS